MPQPVLVVAQGLALLFRQGFLVVRLVAALIELVQLPLVGLLLDPFLKLFIFFITDYILMFCIQF